MAVAAEVPVGLWRRWWERWTVPQLQQWVRRWQVPVHGTGARQRPRRQDVLQGLDRWVAARYIQRRYRRAKRVNDTDPFTLEPVKYSQGTRLFVLWLHPDGGGADTPGPSTTAAAATKGLRRNQVHYDAAVLASYLVSSARFEDPLSRTSMSRADVERLQRTLDGASDPAKPNVVQAFERALAASSDRAPAAPTAEEAEWANLMFMWTDTADQLEELLRQLDECTTMVQILLVQQNIFHVTYPTLETVWQRMLEAEASRTLGETARWQRRWQAEAYRTPLATQVQGWVTVRMTDLMAFVAQALLENPPPRGDAAPT